MEVCDIILVVVLILVVWALVVVVGFRVILSLLECYLLLVFLESSSRAFVAGAYLLRLVGMVAGCLSYVLSVRTLVGLSPQSNDLPLCGGSKRFGFNY